ncbi:MAG: hypothetical protein ACXVH1_34335 [Solirubrobacteraceae bacterium]
MAKETGNTPALIPVHVGLRQPVVAPPVLGAGGGGRFAEAPRDVPLLEQDFDWARHGVTPRWIGMESSDCPAALEPNVFHNHGGVELKRFLEGAASRRETAVLVVTMGNANDDRPSGILGRRSASVLLPDSNGAISGVRTPGQSTITLAAGVEGPDRDLGLRLRSRPADAPWWSMSLSGMQIATAWGETEPSLPGGTLQPILLDAVGQPVVAVWISDSGDQHWYLVPDLSDWDSILDWLVTQALPEFAPTILRRLRSPVLRDPDLLTVAESEAQAALDALGDEYERRRKALQEQLAAAQARPIRSATGCCTGSVKSLSRRSPPSSTTRASRPPIWTFCSATPPRPICWRSLGPGAGWSRLSRRAAMRARSSWDTWRTICATGPRWARIQSRAAY